jgi:tetratricopeptide (TPR) repeat protein
VKKPTRIAVLLFAGAAFTFSVACKPKPKPVTELQRKEAEHLAAEAGFALTLKDWPRADNLLSKAVQIVPDNGMYWLSLGSTRVRAGNKPGAKAAYEGALKAFEREANTEAGKKDPDPWLKQMQTLALLGRVDDARKMLEKTAKQFPDNRTVRAFIDGKQFDRMIADPAFKQGAIN